MEKSSKNRFHNKIWIFYFHNLSFRLHFWKKCGNIFHFFPFSFFLFIFKFNWMKKKQKFRFPFLHAFISYNEYVVQFFLHFLLRFFLWIFLYRVKWDKWMFQKHEYNMWIISWKWIIYRSFCDIDSLRHSAIILWLKIMKLSSIRDWY